MSGAGHPNPVVPVNRLAYDLRMPTARHIGGINILGVIYVVLVLGVVLVPILLRRSDPPDGGSSDGDGGSGRRPPRPSRPPDKPLDGLPLPDAEPASVRLRDHGRLADGRRARRRRPSRAPVRPRAGTAGRSSPD
jgi:hypothetical protein